MNLYEITEQYRGAIERCFDPETGEIINFTIHGMHGELTEKRLAVAGYIKNLEAECEAMKEASKRILDRLAVKKNHIERLTDSLFNSMLVTKDDITEGVELVIRIKTNPPHVVIDDENLLKQAMPNAFKLIPSQMVIDKGLLKQALKEAKIEGAHLEQTRRIEIK